MALHKANAAFMMNLDAAAAALEMWFQVLL